MLWKTDKILAKNAEKRKRLRAVENRQNFSEESREAERLRAVENRQNCSEESREAERLRALWKTDKIVAKKA